MNLGSLPNETWVGILIPLIIALITQWHWSRSLRTFTGFLTCAAAAAIMHAQDWNNLHGFLASLTTILTLAGVFYRAYWLPSGIAPAIDRATTLTQLKPGDAGYND